jgi:hypothetical protein
MSDKKYLFVLGASDPEMAEIETILANAGQRFVYALAGMGESARVHPGNAYKFAGISGEFENEDTVVLVECEPEPSRMAVLEAMVEVIRVDHHRPGDPGYGQLPEKFFEASSLGQIRALVTQITGVGFHEAEENERHALIAAADHCLEAAYRGRCPGVDPDRLMRWRAESRAAFQKRTVEAVLADVEAARTRLRDKVNIMVHPSHIEGWAEDGRNLTDEEAWAVQTGESVRLRMFEYATFGDEVIPELPEAAAREGIPFVAKVRDKDGREKMVLQAAPPELVKRFLAGEVVPGLKDLYGDPARGFAGGYVA